VTAGMTLGAPIIGLELSVYNTSSRSAIGEGSYHQLEPDRVPPPLSVCRAEVWGEQGRGRKACSI
jgi:hypothetical protein